MYIWALTKFYNWVLIRFVTDISDYLIILILSSRVILPSFNILLLLGPDKVIKLDPEKVPEVGS